MRGKYASSPIVAICTYFTVLVQILMILLLEMNMHCRSLHTYLKQSRMAARLSQNEVARKLAYRSSQFVSNWERGLCSPPLHQLSKLCRLYGLRRSSLVRFLLIEEKKKILKHLDLK
jgi:ribosome-binding protein aMBF1 (putative translation factor)